MYTGYISLLKGTLPLKSVSVPDCLPQIRGRESGTEANLALQRISIPSRSLVARLGLSLQTYAIGRYIRMKIFDPLSDPRQLDNKCNQKL